LRKEGRVLVNFSLCIEAAVFLFTFSLFVSESYGLWCLVPFLSIELFQVQMIRD
jgi:hypothetical protein